MYLRIGFCGILLCCLTTAVAMAQTRIGCIDVTSIMASLPQTNKLEQALQIYRQNLSNALEMQYAGMMTAMFPEVPKEGAIDPKPSEDIFVRKKRIEQELDKQIIDAKTNLQKQQTLLWAPLQRLLDSAIHIVSIEQRLDTLLYLTQCPPDPWILDFTMPVFNLRWLEWRRSFIEDITLDPCHEPRTVLAVSKDVIDISSLVLEKVYRWSGH
jgi:Skp family chaperone for outer membrane proteins